MKFDILIDKQFIELALDKSLTPIENKMVLSFANDFEDGEWRYSKFQNFIWDNICETALSQLEREKLAAQSHTKLTAAARNLRLTDKADDISQGSELAEIVLYGIMKNHYKALPVVPKIFYKQNSQDNAKGADSVHIVLESNGDFSVWFGEAKFYNSIEDARIPEILKSVSNSLNSDKLKKENSIVTNLSDINALVADKALLGKIKSALSNQSTLDNLKPRLHIPILLLHECKITASTNQNTEKYVRDIVTYHTERANSFFKKQIKYLGSTTHLYEKLHFHLILFPVPNKKLIIDKFVKHVEFYKEQ
ncbi:MAG: hypothetical protein B7Y41_04920 [Hydrogenophilales bacterium 28-61-23]|nr:MAG: hypothetical protein B7Y41_04920 [Hydrogenophilales bacterium 28-61-23]